MSCAIIIDRFFGENGLVGLAEEQSFEHCSTKAIGARQIDENKLLALLA